MHDNFDELSCIKMVCNIFLQLANMVDSAFYLDMIISSIGDIGHVCGVHTNISEDYKIIWIIMIH